MIDSVKKTYKSIVIGSSAGGFHTIPQILSELPQNYPMFVVLILHMKEDGGEFYVEYLDSRCKLKTKRAMQLEKAERGFIYLAPPDFHLYMDKEMVFSLSVDEKANYSRPSIDVLFESAAKALGNELIGIVLTGMGCDGTLGMINIKERGGLTIVQAPHTAHASEMPENVIKTGAVDHILSPNEIAEFLLNIIS